MKMLWKVRKKQAYFQDFLNKVEFNNLIIGLHYLFIEKLFKKLFIGKDNI